MSDDANMVLEHMWANSKAGDFVLIGQLARALGWTTDRAQAAMDELVDRRWAVGTPNGNAIALGVAATSPGGSAQPVTAVAGPDETPAATSQPAGGASIG